MVFLAFNSRQLPSCPKKIINVLSFFWRHGYLGKGDSALTHSFILHHPWMEHGASVIKSFSLMYLLPVGNGTPLQYSCLENPMDGGAWWAAVHGVAKSQTRLSNFPFTFHFHALGKEMAIHSSVLAWRIPGAGEPGGLLSMGSHRVGHDWSDLAAAAKQICVYSATNLAFSC